MRSYEAHVADNSDYYVYTPSTLAKKLFFYPICVGHFYYTPGYFLKRNNYDSFLVMLITGGECTVTLPERTMTARQGDVVLLDCYAPHQYESATGWEAYWLHFDGPLCRGYYEQITESFGNILLPRNTQTVEHALSKVYHTFQSGTHITEPSISKYITNLLTELLLSGSTKETAPTTRQSLSDTIAYINEHFADSLSLEALADRVSLSPFYFTRVFTRETGMTPHQYLIATRISSAKFLLKSTDLSIKEVGFNCGFTSESSFCTTFRKWEHITPSEYRTLDSL